MIILILILAAPVTANAKVKKISVSTQDEFFTALGHQVLEHRAQQFYYISPSSRLSATIHLKVSSGWMS